MKAGALFALALVCGNATAQINCGTVGGPFTKTEIEATFFTTDRKVTIITFTTSNRADFYELLLRAGSVDGWEYEVDWDPQYRLKVFVTIDEERPWMQNHEVQLRRLVVQLNMTYLIEGGRHFMAFKGATSTVPPPDISSKSGTLDYEAPDVASVLVIAALAESQKLSFRVYDLKSKTIDVTFVRAGLDDAFRALEAVLEWKIERGPRGLIVRRSTKLER